MKLKNLLLLGGCVAMASLSGCVGDEDPAFEKALSVSVVISSSEVQTKAGEATNYDIAKADEILIGNYLIAVFDKDNKCVGFQTNTPTGPNTTTANESGKEVDAYSTTFTDLPSGTLKFVVVANYTTTGFANLGVESTYSAFANQIETTPSFDAKKLLKTGETTVTITPSATTTQVKVPLTQLTARIDIGSIKLVTDGETTEATPETSYGDWEDVTTYDKDMVAATGITNPDENNWRKYSHYYDNYESYEGSTLLHTRRYYFQRRLVTVTKTNSVGSFTLNDITAAGYNTKTDILLNPDASKIENTQYAEGAKTTLSDTTFYTYEFNDSKNENSISMTLNCSYTSGGVKKTTYYEYRYYATFYLYVNWDESIKFSYTTKQVDETVEGKTTINDYTFQIPYKSDDFSIIKGHRYQINGTYKFVSSVIPTLIWRVIDLTKVSNEISFE